MTIQTEQLRPGRREIKRRILKHFTDNLFASLKGNEQASCYYCGEETLFLRFTQGKIKQISDVDQGHVEIKYIKGNKQISALVSLSPEPQLNGQLIEQKLQWFRSQVDYLPDYPYVVPIKNQGPAHSIDHPGSCPKSEELAPLLFGNSENLDYAGLYAGGLICRAYANSAGQSHWFSTENFDVNYSLYLDNQKAVKGSYSDSRWDSEKYLQSLHQSKELLTIMGRTPIEIPRGSYRTYLSPSAVAEILMTMSWGGFSYQALRQGRSALKKLESGELLLSPHFSLSEEFSTGLVPQFNEEGELSTTSLPLIRQGRLQQLLVSSKSAKEYDVVGNSANNAESPRSLAVAAGTLARDQILTQLGTGLYLDNLHYLNWSDIPTGRITGMTRYAAIWVENGRFVAPIKDLRFDETIYHIFGSELEACTNFTQTIAEGSTYFQRELGSMQLPGLLVKNFRFTL